jgi:cobalt/nickel transport protein
MTAKSTPSQKHVNWPVILGIVLIVLIAAIPLGMITDSEFGGSDGAGSDAVKSMYPDYDETWVSNIWSPPGGETESMLFALQAVAGGVLIGYFFGYKNGQKKTSNPH